MMKWTMEYSFMRQKLSLTLLLKNVGLLRHRKSSGSSEFITVTQLPSDCHGRKEGEGEFVCKMLIRSEQGIADTSTAPMSR